MTSPKTWMEWLNTKAGNTISMFLAGAFVVLLATGKISTPWSSQPESKIDKEAIRELFKAEIAPVVEAQKKQADKLDSLALEVANLKGRMQLAGIGTRLTEMGAGRGTRN